MILLQFLSWFWQWTKFENRLISDKVIQHTKKLYHFGGPLCIWPSSWIFHFAANEKQVVKEFRQYAASQGWCLLKDISISIISLNVHVSLNDVVTLSIYFAAMLPLLVIEKCKSLLDISKFLGNPNFDLVMMYIICEWKSYQLFAHKSKMFLCYKHIGNPYRSIWVS